MITVERRWLRVNKHHPCQICEKPDWCGISSEFCLAICMRVQSQRPTRNGGWMHRLADDPPDVVYSKPIRTDAEPTINCGQYYADFMKGVSKKDVAAHAKSLGVDAESLFRLRIGWSEKDEAWSFPMERRRGADFRISGFRLRADDGSKWAVTGSKAGLFVPQATKWGKGLFIAEGPTDTAALLSLGINAIGRPSCLGQEDIIMDYVQMAKSTVVSIASDPDGPGLTGSELLAQRLHSKGIPVRILCPPRSADFRSYIREGATRETIMMLFHNANAWRPGNG